jgi:hypothetical protein
MRAEGRVPGLARGRLLFLAIRFLIGIVGLLGRRIGDRASLPPPGFVVSELLLVCHAVPFALALVAVFGRHEWIVLEPDRIALDVIIGCEAPVSGIVAWALAEDPGGIAVGRSGPGGTMRGIWSCDRWRPGSGGRRGGMIRRLQMICRR